MLSNYAADFSFATQRDLFEVDTHSDDFTTALSLQGNS